MREREQERETDIQKDRQRARARARPTKGARERKRERKAPSVFRREGFQASRENRSELGRVSGFRFHAVEYVTFVSSKFRP